MNKNKNLKYSTDGRLKTHSKSKSINKLYDNFCPEKEEIGKFFYEKNLKMQIFHLNKNKISYFL